MLRCVYVSVKEGLSVMLSAFYPDYVQGADGKPGTASSKMNNPAYLYRLYYQNEILGMNILGAKEAITIDEYTIIFTDPQSYTLIQIKRDPFTWLAAIGAGIVMIALILAFYLRTAEVFALKKPADDAVSETAQDVDGLLAGNTAQNSDAAGSWEISGYSRKGGAEFIDKLKEIQTELEGKEIPDEQ